MGCKISDEFEECGKKVMAEGMCAMHYHRVRRSPIGEPGPVGPIFKGSSPRRSLETQARNSLAEFIERAPRRESYKVNAGRGIYTVQGTALVLPNATVRGWHRRRWVGLSSERKEQGRMPHRLLRITAKGREEVLYGK